MKQKTHMRHYENSIVVPASEADVFAYIDDHARFSSHMNKSSWMMGGGHMNIDIDEEKGQKVGSHIRLKGTVFGIPLFLDEVVIEHNPPYRKAWKTVGDLRLLVIGHYIMKIEIIPEKKGSRCTVSIDYEFPRFRWLGYLFRNMYAKWCVRQMLTDVHEYFFNRERR